MRKFIILVFVLVLAFFLVGCKKSYPTGYAAYPQQAPQQNPNQPYYGGGCGVSPADTTSNIVISNDLKVF